MTIRVNHPSGAVINFPDGTDEATISKVMAGVGKQETTKQSPSWWQRNVTGVRPDAEKNTPSVYDQEDLRSSGNFGSMLFGASDKQLADQIKTQLGSRFIRQETDANGYPIVVWKGQDGSTKRGYVNTPGVDRIDAVRGLAGAVPYVGTGLAGAAAGVGRGLMANAGIQGVVGGLTSIFGDVAQMPLGSEQGIEGEKAGATALFSGAAPVVGRALGNSYEFLANTFRGTPKQLHGLRRGAVNNVVRTAEADNLTQPMATNKAADLGPEGALADYGNNLRLKAAGLARTPGKNREIMLGMTDPRSKMAGARITNDLNANLGVPKNLKAEEKAIRQQFAAQSKPLYDQFKATQIPETREIASIVDQVKKTIPEAITDARKLAAGDGVDPNYLTALVSDPMGAITGTQKATQGKRVWSGLELDYLKRAIDDAVDKAKPGTNEERIYSDLARNLRNTVDEILSPGQPDQSVWAQARKVGGDSIKTRKALERGFDVNSQRGVFSRQEDPMMLRADMRSMSQEEKAALRAGARADLRALAGRSANSYTGSGDVRVRRALNSDFNRENLDLIAPTPQAASNIRRRLDAEGEFARTADAVDRNSVTSQMLAVMKDIPGAMQSEVNFAAEAGKKGPVGLVTEGAARLADMLAGGALGRRNEAMRTDIATILAAQGPRRDAYVKGLLEILGNRSTNADKAAQIRGLVRALGVVSAPQSGRGVAD